MKALAKRLAQLPKWVYGVGLSVALVLGIVAGLVFFSQQRQDPTSPITPDEMADVQVQELLATVAAKKLGPQDLRDTATGIIVPKPATDRKKQGSHILKRDDAPWPLYLVSPIVNLAKYEGKHVKVYGVTYNGGTKDWYMTVNKVEEK